MGSPRGPRIVTPEGFWNNILARDSALARYQGPEQFDSRTVDLNTPSFVSLPPLNLRRPLEEIIIEVRGRATVTVGAYADVSVEAPQNILQRITLRGNHTKFGSQTPIDMTGASAFVYPRCFQQAGGMSFLSVGGGPLTRSPDPGVPFTSAFTGAVATHDFIILYRIPVTPIIGADQSLKRQLANYLYYARDWQDSLQLDLQFGDETAFGDTTGATVAFTGFQSATGLPLLRTLFNYGLLGEFENAAIPAITVRNEQLLNSFVTAGNQLRLIQLQRQITNNVLVKSGVLETNGQTAGVQTFDNLSDLILDRTQIQVDFKPVRRVDSNFAERLYLNGMLNQFPMQGYYNLCFIESQNPLTAYRGDAPSIASADYSLFSDILTTDANQRLSVIQERVIGGVYPAVK
ncbi:MAG TPA: hypothetical protein VJ842_14365 [Pyrinomonadaceae bacterium]|nr:hypothetical protein [Pyrinomonadaceae bacterium]